MALDHLRRQTFEWSGVDRDGSPLRVSGVVRERATVDKFRRTAFKALLPVESQTSFVDAFVRGQFADFVILTEVVEGLPWWVNMYASTEQMAKAFELWQTLPGDLIDVWYEALEDVDQPPDALNGVEPVEVGAGDEEGEDSPNA